MENQNTVETMLAQAQDDAAMGAQDPRTLADVIGADDSSAQEQTAGGQPNASQDEQQEPGWFQRRMAKHDEKRNAEFQQQLAALKESYEAQLAPLREENYRREAEKLVSDGEFKAFDRALEYVKLKAGAPLERAEKGQNEASGTEDKPRDEKGRFAKPDADTERYAQRLVDQARDILDVTGVDVMALYNNDPEVKKKINSREWTFADVYKAAKQGGQGGEPGIPSPVRSSNGFAIGNLSVSRMSDNQFDKFDDFLAKGGRVDMR